MTSAGHPPTGSRSRTGVPSARTPGSRVPAQGAKKTVAKKAAAKKTAPKKAAAKKTAAKKAVVKKAVAKPVVANRAVAKKAVAKRVVAGKTAANRTAARRPVARTTTLRSTGLAAPRVRSAGPPRRPVRRPPRPPRQADPNRRMRLVGVAAAVVLLIFAGRLVQLQVIDASATATAAFDQRERKVVLPAHRGDIEDRNGAVLATTVERRNITLDQRIVNQYLFEEKTLPPAQKGIPGAATALSPILDLSVAELRRRLTGDKAFVYLKKDVEPAVWRQIAELDIPGIFSEQASSRNYPGDQVGASVLGFLSKDGTTPLAGIELAKQSLLQGTDGVLRYERGANGQQIATGVTSETEPVPGRTVQLTIDRDLQWRTQEELCDAVKQTQAASGQAVVLDPTTGQVLALAGCPTFDANNPGTAKPGDLQNRALVDVFEPGSTSKVITAAAALEEGKVTPESPFTVDYTIERGGRTFHDSHDHPPEKLTFAGILAQSSNTGTIQAGERVPAPDMLRYLQRFGLGAPSGIGLPESKGLLAEQWNNSQRYTVLFGQGLSVTALQSAQVFATIANNGVRLQPSIIKAVGDTEGDLVPQPKPSSTRVISKDTATTLRAMLESVVGEDGTAVAASVPGYRVAGKTGTAQFYDDKVKRYNGYTASFVGMAPAEDPKLVVAVFLQQPKKGYFGGQVAAPVFQKVMTYALAKEGIPADGKKAPKIQLSWK